MALSSRVRLSYTWRDGFGTEASTIFPMLIDGTNSWGTIATLWDNLYDLLLPLSNAAIVRGKSWSPEVFDPFTPDAASRVEVGGVFNFGALGSDRRWGAVIPAISPNILIGDRVDLTNADVGAFRAFMEDQGGGSINGMTNDYDQFLTVLRDVFISTRKKRKQLQRSSFETA